MLETSSLKMLEANSESDETKLGVHLRCAYNLLYTVNCAQLTWHTCHLKCELHLNNCRFPWFSRIASWVQSRKRSGADPRNRPWPYVWILWGLVRMLCHDLPNMFWIVLISCSWASYTLLAKHHLPSWTALEWSQLISSVKLSLKVGMMQCWQSKSATLTAFGAAKVCCVPNRVCFLSRTFHRICG